MQLKRLYIKDYKILKDFTIEFPFDFNKYISVFIGANGSGKSTILEAVAQIFSSIYLNEKAKFGFELEYSLKHEQLLEETTTTSEFHTEYLLVKFSAKEKGDIIQIEIFDKKNNTFQKTDIIEKENMRMGFVSNGKATSFSVLPDNIVIYYSGLSEHMDLVCKKHEDIQQKAFYKGNYLAKRELFYYRPENFNMLLLSLLSFEYGDNKEYIFEKLQITETSGFYIKVKRPDRNWAKSKKAKDFWGTEGVLKEFLLILSKYSKFTMIADDENSIEFNFPTIERLYSIKNHYGNERKIFELLDMLLYEDILEDIQITFNKGKKQISSIPQKEEIHFNSKHLSEGEQQSIIIRGLTELLAEKNTLFLFDEPDTYLHPKWQRQFISEIEKSINIESYIENYFLIATHSPQLLSNASTEKNFVKIIENGKLVKNTPRFYGREINTILYELMDVEERNEFVRNSISHLFTLIEEEETKDAEKSLQELQELIGDDDPELLRASIQLEYLKEDE